MSGGMRTSVRLCVFWRIISGPAANGIKCVKPSIATTSPSWTNRATACERLNNSAIGWSKYRSNGSEHGGDGHATSVLLTARAGGPGGGIQTTASRRVAGYVASFARNRLDQLFLVSSHRWFAGWLF